MPDGKTHFISNVLGGTLTTYLAYQYLPDAWHYVLLGNIIGCVVTPDMDLEGTTFTERTLRYIPIVGMLYQLSWYGYALLTRHRGISHNLFLGTITRIAWTFILFVFWLIWTVGIVCLTSGTQDQLVTSVTDWLLNFATIGVFIGWFLQDVNHYVLDAVIGGK